MPGIDGIIGKKLGMTQVYTDTGKCKSVTAIEAGPCKIVQIKAKTTDGYNAAQLGFDQAKRLNAAEKGHLKEMGQFKHLREFRLDSLEGLKAGDVIVMMAGKKVMNIYDYMAVLGELKPGDEAEIEAVREGKTVKVKAIMQKRK